MNKFWDKFGVPEVEGSVIVENIDAVIFIHISEGDVAEGGVDGISRVHCDKAQFRLG